MLFEFLTQGGFLILTQLVIPVASFAAYIVLAIVVMSKLSGYPALGSFCTCTLLALFLHLYSLNSGYWQHVSC